MKKKIFTALLLTTLIGFKTLATHFIGSEISYAKLAPGAYFVTLKKYHLCPSNLVNSTETVLVKAPGCNAGKSITLQKTGHQVWPLFAPTGTPCGTNSSHYGSVTYQGTLTFNGNEQTCPDWILSNSDANRGEVANGNNASGYNLYTESTLKLNNLANNFSPQFDAINPPVPVVSFGQPALISMSATDPDGDSLSYELVQPIADHNVTLPYTTVHTGFTGDFLDPADNLWKLYNRNIAANCSAMYKNNPFDTTDPRPLQIAVLAPNAPANYSAQYPMPSYFPINWASCGTNLPFGPFFNLNPQNGTLELHPAHYVTNSTLGANKYMVSFLVKEWRIINGVPTLLSQVRRETMIFVGQPTTNLPPRLTGPTRGQTTAVKTFTVAPGSTLNYTFTTADGNTADSVYMVSNAGVNLPGSTFTVSSAKLQSGTLNWTPAASQARNQPYYFQIFVRDNNSGLRGYTSETIAVSVRNSGITATKDEFRNSLSLTAFPNPFTEAVNFRINANQPMAGKLIIYNLLGSVVDQVELKNIPAGEQLIPWQPAGNIPAGQYVARFTDAKNRSQVIKFTKLQ